MTDLHAVAPPAAATIPWDAHGALEVLTFDLGGETFAIEAILVQEILDLLPETAVPGAPPLVAHVVNFRGKIVPIADLRLAFGMEQAAPTLDSRIVVIALDLGDEMQLLGLRTDRVHEVTSIAASASEDAPVVGIRWRREHVRCLVRRPHDLVVLPDLAAILTPAMAGAATFS